ILPVAEYTYTFTYRTNRQVGFYESFDELYWNVTGNAWEFSIETASARVFLPESVPDSRLNTTAYTGIQGSQEQSFTENRFSGGHVFYETSRRLNSGEGFTIVVSWPKGHVHEPTFEENLGYFFRDNQETIVGLSGLIVLLIYYLFTWHLLGRDPESGVIITRYQPPKGFSPASLRFVMEMGYDQKCFAAAIINLAVKGYLKISEDDDEYTLSRTGNKVEMAPGEVNLVNKLFQGSTSRTLKNTNHKYISNALEAHENALSRNYETRYFMTNSGYFITGIMLSILVVIATLFAVPDFEQNTGNLFIMAWLTGWSFGVFVLIKNALSLWSRTRGIITAVAAVYATMFALVFTGVEVYVIYSFAGELNTGIFLVVLGGAGINWIFYELLKAPTLAGRRLMDRIAGFQRYLDVAERQQLERKHPQGRTPELFEAYLPHALALEIEQKWAEKFSDVLVKVTTDNKAGYHPAWYNGASWQNNTIGGFSSTLGTSFSNAISSSSTAPGSSSGSG
ncbi:MAG: DUF2207 domain-containing protein, partial [Gammaproteobacteria bacterium]|nr:DUF2207 domain-containing protein [Gammaproteobacteria bacterium]